MDPIRFSLADGQTVTIRPMTQGDLTEIDAMHDRLSKQSLYFRYFAAHKPPLEMLREQMHLSQRQGAAFVAVLDSSSKEIVGMAYYLFTPEDINMAEPAFLVEDRFQNQGLGGALFDGLISAAQSQSLHGFRLFILPENQRMFHILNQIAFPMECHYRDGMFEVQMQLTLQTV